MIRPKRFLITALVLSSLFVCAVYAQDYNVPLTMEGLNHTTNASVVSQSMGGVTAGLKNDVSLMFVNPASLSTLDHVSIYVGGSQSYEKWDQTQQWYPLFNFGNFSTLMDGSTKGISLTNPAVAATWPGDTLWGAFDNLGPNYSRRRTSTRLPDIFIAIPLKNVTFGIGYSQYANMDYYYQNNNTLTPEYDLVLVGNPSNTADSLTRIDWYQSIHKRDGNLYAIGGAISGNITDNISFGASVKYITGSTDDYDATVGRGVLWFYYSPKAQKIWGSTATQCMRVDSASYTEAVYGTSDYSGVEAVVSSQFRGKNATLGLEVTLPTTIVREFNGTVVNFTDKRALFAATHYQHDTSYTETMTLPIKAKAGVSFQVRPNFLVAADYEYSFSKYAKLVSKSGTTKPWTDASSFHFGIDWKPADIVSVRLGYRKQSEVLVAQSAAFNNDPVKYDAYTFGLGTEIISGLQLNVAYEFYELKYEDTWAESYNINRYHSNTISAGLSYTLQ